MDQSYKLKLVQAKAMAKFMRNFLAKTAIFEKVDLFNTTWNSVEGSLEQLLLEDYKHGKMGHATSNFLGLQKSEHFDAIFEFEDIPSKVLLDNVFFEVSDEHCADIRVFNTLKAKSQLIGTFNFNDEGNITYLMSYQIDNMDPLTSIVNYAWLTSNQSKRDKESAENLSKN